MYLITGGSRGIGKALAIELINQGEQVTIVGRNESSLEDLSSKYKHIHYLVADVSLAEDQQKIADYISNPLKGLINNAGIIGSIAPITKITRNDFQQTLTTNVEPALFLTQLLHNKLISGKVLNIGSGAAYFPIKGWTNYCVSKAALSMLTKCWQLEEQDIAVTSVMPGIIDTDMQHVIRNSEFMDDDKLEFFKNLYANKKLLSPQTVALFLTWLLREVSNKKFSSCEWDIYDTTHHKDWLGNNIVPCIT